MSAIEVSNLKKYFGKIHAVDDVSFTVQKGEIFGFLGPNGAGKTTTIRCLLDFLSPSEGRIQILGHDAQKESAVIKNKIGYLSGDVRLYDGWTAKDHILFLEKIRGRKSIARDLIEKLNLNPNIKFKSLSSGNKQKLGLVLALMFEPELLIMDEPTLGLDPLLQNTIYEILDSFQKKGTTVFMSSHNLAEVDRICSRVAIIRDGKIVNIEGIKELKEKRMHLVTIDFNGPYDRNIFNLPGVEIQQELPESIIIGIKGDINPLIRVLANFNLKDLKISHASLEEIFLEFYGQSNNILREPTPKTMGDNHLVMPPEVNNDLDEIPRL